MDNIGSVPGVCALKRIVIATGNPGKMREIALLLAPLGIEVVPQAAYGVQECEEPHGTFIENALAKARHAAAHCELPALADDSGICVEALGGAPGVHSARFAGEPRSDLRNNQRLLDQLKEQTNRRAYYYCVIVLVRHAADPQPVIADAQWRGEVLHAPRGVGGFGYDPLFLLPELGKTAAELPLDEKNRVSHRGRALAQLGSQLQIMDSR